MVELKSDARGRCDMEHLKSIVDDSIAGFMLTNPNTLGLFEDQIEEIADIIHSVDGLIYMDGANLNALLGIVQPGKIGFDVMHFNLHKTFATPHGGGGPGSGPVGVVEKLAPYLPVPTIGLARMAISSTMGMQRPPSAKCTPSTATLQCCCAPISISRCWARRA